MNEVFTKYAKYYDVLYSDKDYDEEIKFIESSLKKYYKLDSMDVLDLGCGTGGHMIPLLKQGYNLTGVDLSSSMLSIARDKIKMQGFKAKLINQSIAEFKSNKKFGICICMFDVVNYITKNSELLKSFKNIRKHMKKNGILIFDFWYGPGVLNIKPSMRIKDLKTNEFRIIRTVEPEMEINNHLLKSHYNIIVIKKDKIIDEFKETHIMRYLFPLELELYLERSDFKLINFSSFPDFNRPPSETSWSASAIALAV